eukprot:07915.XXX_430330_430608_1 [CDS] Oithona nana genome sequencing.
MVSNTYNDKSSASTKIGHLIVWLNSICIQVDIACNTIFYQKFDNFQIVFLTSHMKCRIAIGISFIEVQSFWFLNQFRQYSNKTIHANQVQSR